MYRFYDDTPTYKGFEFVESTNTPNYRSLKASGVRLPSHPYKKHRQFRRSAYAETYNGMRTDFDARGHETPLAAVGSGQWNNQVGEVRPLESFQELYEGVNGRLLSKIRNTSFDAGVALGEFRETASFVSSAFDKTYASYRRLHEGRTEKALRILMGPRYKRAQEILRIVTGRTNSKFLDVPGVSADMWLVYSYALRPLVKDVYDVIDLYSKRANTRSGEKIKVRSTLKRDLNVNIDTGSYIDKSTGMYSVSRSVVFVIDNPLVKKLDEVGLTNPISTAFNLFPLSFILGWFSNVNSVVQNVVPPQGVTVVDGYTCYGLDASTEYKTNIEIAPGYAEPPYWRTSATLTEVYRERVTEAVMPQAPPLKIDPAWDLSKSQVASSFALLWQAFSSSKGSFRLRV